MWPEIERARDENRKELVLSGSKATHEIDSGLDPAVYTLTALNYLEINGIAVNLLSDDLGNLANLTSLILKKISISKIPSTIDKLKKLKILDLSFNCIEELPSSIVHLSNLESLLVGSNKIEELPDEFSKLSRLHILDLSHNRITSIEKICQGDFVHLHSVNVRNNAVIDIPGHISKLSALKTLDVSGNLIEQVPGELAECGKLKELELKDNKLKDNRFTKLVNQGKYKAILDYVRKNCPVMSGGGSGDAGTGAGGKGKKKKGKGENREDVRQDEDGVDEVRDLVEVLHFNAETPTVTIDESVLDVRPHIVCCVVKGVDLSDQGRFKKFIQLQTKLHDDMCEKRTVATIATHDLALIKGPLRYQAQLPNLIQIQPLFKARAVSGEELVNKLRKEADDYRKEHKRNTFSGIHRYLELLDGVEKYPCLVDEGNSNNVISFPPITNSDTTKVSSSSHDLLLEVTSSQNIHVCKSIMDQLLHRLLTANLTATPHSESSYLVVQQVRVVDSLGQLKLVYPARTDLVWADQHHVKVKRDY